nr:aminotransferase class I/II-fold pyridoxal phosphate-dependent enzyme [Salmonella enterica]
MPIDFRLLTVATMLALALVPPRAVSTFRTEAALAGFAALVVFVWARQLTGVAGETMQVVHLVDRLAATDRLLALPLRDSSAYLDRGNAVLHYAPVHHTARNAGLTSLFWGKYHDVDVARELALGPRNTLEMRKKSRLVEVDDLLRRARGAREEGVAAGRIDDVTRVEARIAPVGSRREHTDHALALADRAGHRPLLTHVRAELRGVLEERLIEEDEDSEDYHDALAKEIEGIASKVSDDVKAEFGASEWDIPDLLIDLNVYNEALSLSHSIGSDLSVLQQVKMRGRNKTHERGITFDGNRLILSPMGVRDVFRAQSESKNRGHVGLVLVRDISASMANDERYIHAIKSDLALSMAAESLSKMHVSNIVFPFKESEFEIIKTFDQRVEESLSKFTLGCKGYYTPTGSALMAAVDLLLDSQFDRKIIFLITDGYPNKSEFTIGEVMEKAKWFPSGHLLSLARRHALIDWARTHNAWIIEDDYDSEFHYNGAPVACMQGLDREQRTLYVGTFSKTLYPGLRIGSLVVPASLAAHFAAARNLLDGATPALTQLTLARFIASGHFAAHIRTCRRGSCSPVGRSPASCGA